MLNRNTKFPVFGLLFFCCFLAQNFYGQPIQSKNPCPSPNESEEETKDLVVITDMEPDDRIALAIIASQLAKRVLAIGTTLLHAERKAALARHALIGTALEGAQVYVGSGGTSEDYPKMKSTEAARTYGDKEGKGILEDEVLDMLNEKKHCPGVEENEFQNYLKDLLLKRKNGLKIQFLVLAPPTDLTAVLCQNRELASAIGEIHLMGGWNKCDEKKDAIPRSSFNVNMDGAATARLLQMANNNAVKVVLYSAHVLAEQFGGGSVNRDNFLKLIEMIKHSKAPCIKAFRTAGKSWDTNLVQCYKKLEGIVGPYAGEQFTPADPITVLGFMKPELIKETMKMKVEVIIPEPSESVICDKDEGQCEEGFEVKTEEDCQSGITLITKFDLDLFGSEMERIMEEIDRYETERHQKEKNTQ
ncbi:hypothetical protein niasHT_001333 [Heterodera trifolii]|uniref:Inosine/uridine-preferring nucleoside hydrolase domain-containing protein n=1 Tax=Heterodera trifolii TaxID=157864 RepID=A0ABD2LMW9_9BILA